MLPLGGTLVERLGRQFLPQLVGSAAGAAPGQPAASTLLPQGIAGTPGTSASVSPAAQQAAGRIADPAERKLFLQLVSGELRLPGTTGSAARPDPAAGLQGLLDFLQKLRGQVQQGLRDPALADPAGAPSERSEHLNASDRILGSLLRQLDAGSEEASWSTAGALDVYA